MLAATSRCRHEAQASSVSVKRQLAHLSDLHLGHRGAARAAERLVEHLLRSAVDHVVVTGDITESGEADELALFERLFAPLLDARRVTVIPGNHDRAGEGHGMRLARGRLWREAAPGLHLVCLDTTGPHNRSYIASHGELSATQVDGALHALDVAPAGALRVVLMHHHPLPLPDEGFAERLATRLGWPHALELPRGRELVERCAGRCDLVLHGHKHVPTFRVLRSGGSTPLYVANAGSTTELGAFQVYEHERGRLVAARLERVDGSAPVVRRLESWPSLELAA